MNAERDARADGREESGFTLIELIIVIVIESLIVAGIGTAFVLVMNNSTTVKESLARTNDARFAAQYIVSDAANSSGPETSLSDTTSCPDPSPPVSGTATAVVRFDWSSTSSVGVSTPDIVDYVLVSNSLLRRECQNGTLIGDDVLSTNIASATVACSPGADCSGTPTSITATITETQGSSAGSPYQYSLTGAFRKALAVGSPLPPAGPSYPYPLLALGASCSGGFDGIKLSGTAGMRVHGDAYLNTADSGNCNALSVAGSSTFKTTGSTKILTGGTCAQSGSAVCPTTTAYSPAYTDPYASLTAPSTSGLPAQSGCAGGTAQPGVYASALALSGAATCNLASGVYIFQNGLSTANTAVLTNDAAGVLIYITGGTFSIGGNSTVTLSAMTTGTYSGLAVWQAAADTTTLSNGNSSQLTITGAVYAPKAEFDVSGSAQPTVSAVIAQSIVVGNSAVLTIGTPLAVANPATLPAYTVNKTYPSTTFTATGGDGSYTWSASGLPAGLTINASTGVLSGTPTAAGSTTPTISVNDAFGDPAGTKQYTVVINAAPAITTTSPLSTGEQTVPYSVTLAKSGGTALLSWSATGLPAGLSIDSSTGVISGTPTTTGTSSASVTLTDSTGATATKSLSLTINPTPTVTSVVLSNGGSTAGRLEKSDTIVVTYSAQMSVSNFCSTWSNDTHNQTLNTASDVTVSVSNGAGSANDTLSVSSATCTFNFGTMDLGSGGYVSAATTFGGSGSNKSTIAWNATAHTLTITLGAMISGSVATVASSAPIYSVPGTIQDSAGAGVANSPFTLPAAQQF